jgi:hypothetical protein
MLLAVETAIVFVVAMGNCLYFGRYAATAARRARRVGALALVLVNAAFALEALLTLTGREGTLAPVASLAQRGLSLIATGFLTLLIWRQGFRFGR